MKNKILNYFNNYYLDIRGITFLRISLALLSLVYLYKKTINFHTFFDPSTQLFSGNVHKSFVFEALGPSWSVFWINQSPIINMAILSIAVLSAFLLLFNKFPRITSLFLWIFMVSCNSHVFLFNLGGDFILEILLFYNIFIQGIKEKEGQVRGIIVAPFFILAMGLYFASGLVKNGDIWIKDFTAIWYALHLYDQVGLIGVFLREYLPMWIFKILTFVTIFVEVVFILFLPLFYKNWKGKTFFNLVFFGFHFSLFIIFKIEFFATVCMVFWITLMPKEFWDFILRKRQIEKNIILKNPILFKPLIIIYLFYFIFFHASLFLRLRSSYPEIRPLLPPAYALNWDYTFSFFPYTLPKEELKLYLKINEEEKIPLKEYKRRGYDREWQIFYFNFAFFSDAKPELVASFVDYLCLNEKGNEIQLFRTDTQIDMPSHKKEKLLFSKKCP